MAKATAKAKARRKAAPKLGAAGRRVRLNVKILPEAHARLRGTALSGTPGLQNVIQLFPEEPEEEMQSMYIVEVDPSSAELALKKLLSNPAVEYAEETPRHKLIW